MCHKYKHHMAQKRDTYIVFLDKIRKRRSMFSCHAITASKRNALCMHIIKWEMDDLTNSNEWMNDNIHI